MRVRGPAKRVPWKHTREVPVPPEWRPWLWDHPEGRAPLEKLILRVLRYGTFEDLQKLMTLFPRETADTARRHREELPRGVLFWVEAFENARSG